MKMQKRTFRIGELAEKLQVERFVVRFWEKEFGIRTTRSHGGQRFYTEDDLALFHQVKKLLYEDGFTIAGAKKTLKKETTKQGTRVRGSHRTFIDEISESPADVAAPEKKIKQLSNQIAVLKDKLQKLKQLL